ncbi:9261_t:CDS:2, partial [Acaulospora morrowiae]
SREKETSHQAKVHRARDNESKHMKRTIKTNEQYEACLILPPPHF